MIVVATRSKEVIPPKSCRTQLAIFWETYLNFQYHFLCCPFRLAIARDRKCATTKTFLLQKILCFIFALLGFFWNIRNLQLSLPSNPKDPTMYLLLAVEINTIFLKVSTTRRYWCNEKKLLKIVNYILDTKNNLPFPVVSQKINIEDYVRVGAVVACSFYTALGIAHWLTGRLYFIAAVKSTPILSWNASIWWDQMLGEGRYTFCLNNQVSSVLMESIAAALAAVGYLWRLVLGANENMFYVIMSFTLWVTTYEFQSRLQPPRWETYGKPASLSLCSEIFLEYKAIRTLADMINSVLGWTMFYMVVQATLFSSINTGDIFLNDSTFDGIRIFGFGVYFFTICVTFLLMADACKRVHGT